MGRHPILDIDAGLLINIRIPYIMKPVDCRGKALEMIARFSSHLGYNAHQQENSSFTPSL